MSLPKLNLAALKGGPAMLYINGQSIYTKTGITFDPSPKWEKILVDGFDETDQAKSAMELSIKFTPAGQYTAAHVAALCPQLTLPTGRWVTPVLPLGTVNTTDNTIVCTAHGQTTGQASYVGSDNTLPAPLATGTVYYLRSVDANTISLHDSAAHASANTNLIDLTTAGTGNHSLVINYELKIQSISTALSLTLHNVAITGALSFDFTASGKTIFGDINISAFLRHNKAPGDANAYYTISTTDTFDASTFPSMATILTQPYEAAWGATAPWNAIRSKDGFKFQYTPKLEDVTIDGLGIVTKQLTGATAVCGFTPTDAGDSDLLSLAHIDSAMGSRLQTGSNDLIVSGTGAYAKLYSAGFSKTPLLYNMKDRRAGAVELMATRQFPLGVAQPLLYVGTSAPA